MNNSKIIAAILVGTAILIFFLVYISEPKNIINRIEPSFVPEQRAVFEQQLKDAQKNIDAITKETPNVEQATRYSLLARAYSNLGDYQEARRWFEKAVKIKRNIPVYLEYYNLLTAMHDFEAARDVARAGLAIYPLNFDIWQSLIALSRSQFEANDTEITSLYLEALAKSESQPELLADFARYQEELGRPEEALKYWRAAVIRAPQVAFYQQQVERLEIQLK